MSPRRTRLYGTLVAVPCWAALITAAILTPASTGHGTHRQLHLPGCNMLQTSGWPCPTCGITTSVSAMVHGALSLAWKAHPFGVVLFIAIVLLGAAATVQAVSGKNVLGVLRPRAWWVAIALAGLLAGWGIKAMAGAIDGTYPMR